MESIRYAILELVIIMVNPPNRMDHFLWFSSLREYIVILDMYTYREIGSLMSTSERHHRDSNWWPPDREAAALTTRLRGCIKNEWATNQQTCILVYLTVCKVDSKVNSSKVLKCLHLCCFYHKNSLSTFFSLKTSVVRKLCILYTISKFGWYLREGSLFHLITKFCCATQSFVHFRA